MQYLCYVNVLSEAVTKTTEGKMVWLVH